AMTKASVRSVPLSARLRLVQRRGCCRLRLRVSRGRRVVRRRAAEQQPRRVLVEVGEGAADIGERLAAVGDQRRDFLGAVGRELVDAGGNLGSAGIEIVAQGME